MFMSVFPVQLGSLELVGELGSGGMARVFEAWRVGAEGVRTRVAVKCLIADRAWDAKAVAMFIQEARLNAQLRHPNIIAVHDFSAHEGIHYIVMELVDGCDLAILLEVLSESGRRLPPVLAVEILRQILLGLDYAHAAVDADGHALRLVHRDLKPANIFLTRHGVVKIGDFGIAKSRASMLDTTVGVFKGTPAYFSPEQFRGEPVTPASDLFAVGLILVEMLTGARLFREGSLAELAGAMLRFEPAVVLEMLPNDAAALAPFFSRCLARCPDGRYATAGEALAELSGLIGDASAGGKLGAFLEPLLPSIRARRAAQRALEAGTAMATEVTSGLDSDPRISGAGIGWPSGRAMPTPRGAVSGEAGGTRAEGAGAQRDPVTPERIVTLETAAHLSRGGEARRRWSTFLGGTLLLFLGGLAGVHLRELSDVTPAGEGGRSPAVGGGSVGGATITPSLAAPLETSQVLPRPATGLEAAASDMPGATQGALPGPPVPSASSTPSLRPRVPGSGTSSRMPAGGERQPRGSAPDRPIVQPVGPPATPPSEAPARAQPVDLVLSTLPNDRTVSIDGGMELPVPWSGRVSAGRHRITFHCEEYEHTVALDLSDGRAGRMVWNCPARAPFHPEPLEPPLSGEAGGSEP